MSFISRALFILLLGVGFFIVASKLAIQPAQAEKRPPARKSAQKVSPKDAVVQRALKKTIRIFTRAFHAHAQRDQAYDVLWQSAVRQRAARFALRKGHVAQAMHLTLDARQKAREVLLANKVKSPREEVVDSSEEIRLARGEGSEVYLKSVEGARIPRDYLIHTELDPPMD